jgi:hypothetical protein
MDGVENLHIVDFEKYCDKCVFKEKSESEDPCWDCLEDGVSHNGVPTEFKKAVK